MIDHLQISSFAISNLNIYSCYDLLNILWKSCTLPTINFSFILWKTNFKIQWTMHLHVTSRLQTSLFALSNLHIYSCHDLLRFLMKNWMKYENSKVFQQKGGLFSFKVNIDPILNQANGHKWLVAFTKKTWWKKGQWQMTNHFIKCL